MIRKFKMNALRQKLAEIQALIDESDARLETDSDAGLEPTDRPAAMDSAPSLDTRTGRKLVAVARGDTAAARALNRIPGYSRLQR